MVSLLPASQPFFGADLLIQKLQKTKDSPGIILVEPAMAASDLSPPIEQ